MEDILKCDTFMYLNLKRDRLVLGLLCILKYRTLTISKLYLCLNAFKGKTEGKN